MATRQSTEISFANFGGGRASVKNPTTLTLNEASDLDNVVIKPSGAGFRSRDGNTEFNATAMVSGSTPVTGLGYFKDTSSSEWLMAVAGTKLYKSDSLDGTMDDITGAVTITSGQNNLWDIFTFNDLSIGVGGAPDAPFKWDGTGNGAALGGSPPSGETGLAWNNRVWIASTSTNPSVIYWSVLADPEDWSGDGSGNATVNKDDGEPITAIEPVNSNILLVFKKNSTHQLVGRSAPFSVFSLFQNTGCVGKHAVVSVDGLVYFVTPRGHMIITDGNEIIDEKVLPSLSSADDVWDGLNRSRLKYIQGFRYKGYDFDHIVWMASNGSSTTNNYAVVWDILNKCWLTHSTGHPANARVVTGDNVPYIGAYDGKIYKMYVDGTHADASDSGANVAWYWRSDWFTSDSLQKIAQIQRVNIAYETQASGSMTLGYGYDFVKNSRSKTFSIEEKGDTWDESYWDTAIWGGFSDIIKPNFIVGRGNVFNVQFSGSDAVTYNINRYSIFGKQQSDKHFDAS